MNKTLYQALTGLVELQRIALQERDWTSSERYNSALESTLRANRPPNDLPAMLRDSTEGKGNQDSEASEVEDPPDTSESAPSDTSESAPSDASDVSQGRGALRQWARHKDQQLDEGRQTAQWAQHNLIQAQARLQIVRQLEPHPRSYLVETYQNLISRLEETVEGPDPQPRLFKTESIRRWLRKARQRWEADPTEVRRQRYLAAAYVRRDDLEGVTLRGTLKERIQAFSEELEAWCDPQQEPPKTVSS